MDAEGPGGLEQEIHLHFSRGEEQTGQQDGGFGWAVLQTLARSEDCLALRVQQHVSVKQMTLVICLTGAVV